MSYVRLGVDGSQVYIFEHVAGYVECCFCAFSGSGGDDFHTTVLDEMLAHVAEHRAAGHTVPEWVDRELSEDWPVYGDTDG